MFTRGSVDFVVESGQMQCFRRVWFWRVERTVSLSVLRGGGRGMRFEPRSRVVVKTVLA